MWLCRCLSPVDQLNAGSIAGMNTYRAARLQCSPVHRLLILEYLRCTLFHLDLGTTGRMSITTCFQCRGIAEDVQLFFHF